MESGSIIPIQPPYNVFPYSLPEEYTGLLRRPACESKEDTKKAQRSCPLENPNTYYRCITI